jgi:hypothetical protein
MKLWRATKPLIWAAFRTVSRINIILRKNHYRYVFILGHVRSGSSLLAHILANHQDIVGAGESHITYRTASDLPNLVLKTSELLHRPIIRETYVVDQINHPYVADDVLLSDQLYKSVILLREPVRTLKSMVSLSVWHEKQALDLYISRLESLSRYGLLLGNQALLIEYDDLVDQISTTLTALTRFLNLDSPLMETYTTHRQTGRAGWGDPSENIKSGRIVRTPDHDVTLSEETLRRARMAFQECQTQLRATVTLAFNRASWQKEAV